MALWTSSEIALATQGRASDHFDVNGVAFDSREVGPEDLFVALRGETTDGHRFVEQAFSQGAAGILASQPVAGPHILVPNTTSALDALGAASRQRMRGKVIGVTGSVGKTSVKEALFAALDRAVSGKAHRSLKSYNNHVGVPLSLARMPRDTQYGVFEMGMNHAGELAQLTRLVRPHVALVTTVALAHGAFFKDESEIADAKGEIFRGLEPGGIAIIPYDNPHRDRLMAAAQAYAGQIVTFGRDPKADVYAREGMPGPKGTFVQARLRTCELTLTVGLPGDHWITNALAVLAVVEAAGGDPGAAGLALADMAGLPGRGRRITIRLPDGDAMLIDEAYNANPASMRATLSMLGQERGRKVAILGSMRELGPQEAELHAALAAPITEAGVDLALLVGTEMKPLAEALEGKVEFVHVTDAASAADRAHKLIAPGDAILVKGSNSVGLAGVVDALAGG